jgi:copper(I)-binding protein
MRHIRPILTGILLVLLATGAVSAAAETGKDPTVAKAVKPHHVYLVGQLRVMQPWIDVPDGSADRADAYLVVENRGASPERLTGARTEAADHVTIVDTDEGDGSGVTIPPHSTVTLRADQTHLQLDGLHPDLRGKDKVTGVLTFERAGPLHIQFSTSQGDALKEDQSDPTTDAPASLVK